MSHAGILKEAFDKEVVHYVRHITWAIDKWYIVGLRFHIGESMDLKYIYLLKFRILLPSLPWQLQQATSSGHVQYIFGRRPESMSSRSPRCQRLTPLCSWFDIFFQVALLVPHTSSIGLRSC